MTSYFYSTLFHLYSVYLLFVSSGGGGGRVFTQRRKKLYTPNSTRPYTDVPQSRGRDDDDDDILGTLGGRCKLKSNLSDALILSLRDCGCTGKKDGSLSGRVFHNTRFTFLSD